MDIKEIGGTKSQMFADIEFGRCFRRYGTLYQKLNRRYRLQGTKNSFNCVEMETGNIAFMEFNDAVIQVNGYFQVTN